MKYGLLIPSLEIGGAERQMVLLARELQARKHEVGLWCLRSKGPFFDIARELGINVIDLEKKGRYDLIAPAIRFKQLCKTEKPDVVISCLPSANLYALIGRFLGGKFGLVWGLASAKLPVGEYGLWAKMSYMVQAKFSSWVDAIVVNSVAGYESAIEEGYSQRRLKVIHNGIDTADLRYDKERGRQWRKKIGVPIDAKLIGMVGRLDPAKNYEVFLKASELAAQREEELWFVIVGGGDTDYAEKLRHQIQAHSLSNHRLIHVEHETDMEPIYSALDLMTLTSKSEGLPNTIVEALACERLCVVTDVGDCRLAVGRFGKVCQVGDTQGIVSAWVDVLEQCHPDQPPAGLREYVEEHFSLGKMSDQFEKICGEIVVEKCFRG